MFEKIASIYDNSGTYCRMLQLPAGFEGGPEQLEHDFDEIVFIVSREIINERLKEECPPGTAAIFSAGVKHGPLSAPEGALSSEFRHYKKNEQNIDVSVRSHHFLSLMVKGF